MPPALTVDREAVRVLVLAVGVREAARQMGLSENSVKSWCTRGEWLAPTPIPPTVQRPASIAPNAPKSPADALRDALAADSQASRASMSRALRKVSSHVARLPAKVVLDRSQDVKASIQSLALVHGWEAKAGPSAAVMVNVNLLGLSVEPGAIDV